MTALDDLCAQIQALYATQADSLAACQVNYATLQTDAAKTAAELVDAKNALNAVQQALATANTKILQLTNPPAPTPAPSCRYGAYPRTGSGTADIAAMDAKYGVKVPALRLFWPGALGPVPGAGRFIVGSFKTMPPDVTALQQLDHWTFQHEIDSKVAKGQYDLPTWKTNMTALSKLGVPGLCVIVTANCFVSSAKNPEDYIGWARDTLGVTHFGADFDGISYIDHYHDYSRETAAVHAYADKHGMTWGVPEVGANRAANDPTGTVRAAWTAKTLAANAAAGAEYQLLWESTGQAGSEYKTPAETAVWTGLFA